MRMNLLVVITLSTFFTLGCTPEPSDTQPSTTDGAGTGATDSQAPPTMVSRSNTEISATERSSTASPQTESDRPSGSDAGIVRMIAWNVESGGNDPVVISQQLSEFQGIDVICLSEVSSANFERYAAALEGRYHEFHGDTGRADRLQIFVKRDRYEILEEKEMSQHREFVLNKGYHRSPLYVRIKDRLFGDELIVMTNHLARGNAKFRQEQAVGLREWARDQNVAVIALGDFNMDYDYRTMKGNPAFDEMVRDNVWSWLAPNDFIDTNWSDRDGDGNDNYPDSMLDLAFAAGAAKEWGIECRVVIRPDDFPDDRSTSDHRPIEIIYTR